MSPKLLPKLLKKFEVSSLGSARCQKISARLGSARWQREVGSLAEGGQLARLGSPPQKFQLGSARLVNFFLA